MVNDNRELQNPFRKINLKKLNVLIPTFFLVVSIFFIFIKFYALIFGIYTGVWILLAVFSSIFMILNFIFRKKDELRIKLLTIFTSTAIIILSIEIILRLFGVGTSGLEQRNGVYNFEIIKEFHVWKKNDSHLLITDEYKYIRTTNSLGLSDIEHPLEKQKGESLIIGLGDSFTEGDGAHADSTWLKFLEHFTSENKQKQYRYMNAGVCGSDPVYQYHLLEQKLLVYQPDIVILNIGFDIDDIIFRGGFERFEKKGFIYNRNIEFFYATSFIFRLFLHNILDYNYLNMSEERHSLEVQKALQITKQTLLKFKNLAQKQKFQFLVVFYPGKEEIINNQYQYWDEIMKFSNQEKIHTLNLLNYFVNKEKINRANIYNYYWLRDGHPKAKGYEAYGRAVFEKLEEIEMKGNCNNDLN